MKLLLIGNPAIIHTRRLAIQYAQRGHEVHLIGEHPLSRPLPQSVSLYDLPHGMNVPKLRYLWWGVQTRRLAKEIRPDVLHAISVASAGWLGVAAGYGPFVVTALGSDLLLLPQKGIIHRMLSRQALRRADRLICVSDGLYRQALALGYPAERLETIYLSVDLDIFNQERPRTAARQRFGLPPAGPVVASIRAIQPIYNPLQIARAIPLILHQAPDTHFAIATYNSDPDLIDQFRQVLQDSRVENAVSFIPPQHDERAIADLYRAADVAVSIAASDGTPASVLEATACGAGMVLGDIPALRDWFEHERHALFVDPKNPEQIAAAAIRVIQDQRLRSTLQQNALEVIREKADSDVMYRRSLALYRELLKTG